MILKNSAIESMGVIGPKQSKYNAVSLLVATEKAQFGSPCAADIFASTQIGTASKFVMRICEKIIFSDKN